jgi:hypothetical protein
VVLNQISQPEPILEAPCHARARRKPFAGAKITSKMRGKADCAQENIGALFISKNY